MLNVVLCDAAYNACLPSPDGATLGKASAQFRVLRAPESMVHVVHLLFNNTTLLGYARIRRYGARHVGSLSWPHVGRRDSVDTRRPHERCGMKTGGPALKGLVRGASIDRFLAPSRLARLRAWTSKQATEVSP